VSDDEEDHDCVSDTDYHGVSAVYVKSGWHKVKDIFMIKLDVPWGKEFGVVGHVLYRSGAFQHDGGFRVVVMLVV